MNRRASALLLAALAAACNSPRDRADVRQQGGAGAFNPATWTPPADSEIPADSLGAAIRRGRALVLFTNDSLPAYAPGRIRCSNCHMNGGRSVDAAPLAGSYARFPKYLERAGTVIGLADRVNYCFTRSLAGTKLPVDSREMQDILAYLAWLSRGVPLGEGKKLPGADGIASLPEQLQGDTARGRAVYAGKCAACHGVDGSGNAAIRPGVPAVWGAKSFSVGASMTRLSKSASFIWHNMPYGAGRSLSSQEAYDVAAFVTSQPRPDSPGKENDWPNGGAPRDVPYATRGHAASAPPPLIKRGNPSGAIVGAPASVRTKTTR